jgi:hypothetical protein
MGGVLKRAVVKRVSGETVSPIQAALAAAVAGAAAAVLTYRAMRS